MSLILTVYLKGVILCQIRLKLVNTNVTIVYIS